MFKYDVYSYKYYKPSFSKEKNPCILALKYEYLLNIHTELFYLRRLIQSKMATNHPAPLIFNVHLGVIFLVTTLIRNGILMIQKQNESN